MINAGSTAQECKRNILRSAFCASSGWLHRHLPCPPCCSNCGDRLPSYRNVCNKPSRRVSCHPNIPFLYKKAAYFATSFHYLHHVVFLLMRHVVVLLIHHAMVLQIPVAIQHVGVVLPCTVLGRAGVGLLHPFCLELRLGKYQHK